MLSGGALISAPAADLTSLDPDGDRVFVCPTTSVNLSGVNAGGRIVLRGAEGMQFTASGSSMPMIAADEKGYASLAPVSYTHLCSRRSLKRPTRTGR